MRTLRISPDQWRPLWRVANRLEAVQLRWLGTSGIKLLRRTDVVALVTVGRRSGKRRRTPLAYWVHEDGSYLLGGGAAGMTRVDWVANLRANPAAAVWLRRRFIPVVAGELKGEDYEAVRQEAFRRWPDAALYERRSGRRIPYFRLAVDSSTDRHGS